VTPRAKETRGAEDAVAGTRPPRSSGRREARGPARRRGPRRRARGERAPPAAEAALDLLTALLLW
jgi:hypothetical protein